MYKFIFKRIFLLTVLLFCITSCAPSVYINKNMATEAANFGRSGIYGDNVGVTYEECSTEEALAYYKPDAQGKMIKNLEEMDLIFRIKPYGFQPGEKLYFIDIKIDGIATVLFDAFVDSNGKLIHLNSDYTKEDVSAIPMGFKNFCFGETGLHVIGNEAGTGYVGFKTHPKPIQVFWEDGAHALLGIDNFIPAIISIEFDHFKPGEEINYSSESCNEVDSGITKMDDCGKGVIQIYPEVPGQPGGKGKFKIQRADGEEKTLEYGWGLGMIEYSNFLKSNIK